MSKEVQGCVVNWILNSFRTVPKKTQTQYSLLFSLDEPWNPRQIALNPRKKNKKNLKKPHTSD